MAMAPSYLSERCRLTSVEHPFIVRNADKVADTLGGSSEVAKLVNPKTAKKGASLYLRRDDPMTVPITSANVATDNLLLEISVPKLTGRKRKRGSDGPFQEYPSEQNETSPDEGPRNLLKRLSKSSDQVDIRTIGPIAHTHRFRSMPDFAYSTSKQKYMEQIHRTLLPLNYDKAKTFRFSPSKGVHPPTELIPPPKMSHFDIPFNYSYHQNPAMRAAISNTGTVTLHNDSASRKIWTERLLYSAPTVPLGPPEGVAPASSLGEHAQSTLARVNALMADRPIWTRRALVNALGGPSNHSILKHLLQHVGYTFRSGPWREAVIRYGVDPRSDPKYRVYQTMMLQLEEDQRASATRGGMRGQRGGRRVKGESSRKDGGLGCESHVFNGVVAGFEGKLWQVCDITDPLLASILGTENLRERCHVRTDGWYHNGTWAKARIIAKTKLNALKLRGMVILDSEFSNIVAIPDVLETGPRGKQRGYARSGKPLDVGLAAAVRGMAATPEREEDEDDYEVKEDEEDEEDEDEEGDDGEDRSGEEDEGEDSDEDELNEDDIVGAAPLTGLEAIDPALRNQLEVTAG